MAQCTLALQQKEQQLRRLAAQNNIRYAITCTGRSLAEQQALYAQGRQPLAVVNTMRKNVGMQTITEEQNNHKVTWTLDSKHIITQARPLSEAFDIVILDGSGKATYDLKVDVAGDKIPDYIQLAKLAVTIGLTPGALWKTPDYPHYQL
jgi:hypothetical protein